MILSERSTSRSGRLAVLVGVGTAVIVTAGCAGGAGGEARREVLSPALLEAWPGIREDAMLGAEARADPVFMASRGSSSVVPGVVESRKERIRQFESALNLAAKR